MPATLGLLSHSTDQTPPITEVARAVEDRGLTSLFVCEHTHIPVGAPSVSPRGILPEWTKRIPDPYISLAFAAATTGLTVGTAVALPAEHDPIVLAKAVATLDQLSGGRFVFGVGWGWHREEFSDHRGFPPNRRVDVLREHLDLMRAVWRHDEAEYEGEFARLPRSWSWPKPAQPGGPPVLLGVPTSPKNFERIAAWADGWIPMHSVMADDFGDRLDELRRAFEAAGRDPGALDVTAIGSPSDADELRRTLARADQLGVRRLLVQVVAEDGDRLEEILDRLAPAGEGR